MIFIATLSHLAVAFGISFPLAPNTDVVGEVYTTVTQRRQTLLDLGLRHGLGYYEILEANPNLPPKSVKSQTKVVIANQFILPDAPREGIVVNLPELRLYLYPPDGQQVITFPVGIGRYGWSTPQAEAKIIDKRKNPQWYVPESIFLDMQRRGITIPRVWPASPKNPLGQYAMRLDIPGYDIHGTNRKDGVGRRTSAGCIRMLNEDIAEVYYHVDAGTKVSIVNQPFKIGVKGQDIFFEVHIPLYEETIIQSSADFEQAAQKIVRKFLMKNPGVSIDWEKVKEAVQNPTGIPIVIGHSNVT